jgi:phosphoenolpyruvate-protein kinase (PTS system EI component)
MNELQAFPFVPGIARGKLCHGGKVTPDSILIVMQQEPLALDSRPAGIVVVGGAPFSHPMIRLFGLGIPTVMVTQETARSLEEGREVLVDGTRGRIVWPVGSTVQAVYTPDLLSPAEPPHTADGFQVGLRASVSSIADVERAVLKGASAIGLVRSEYLIPENGQLPDANFYESVFSTLCDIARPLPVTIRLLDIAVDKPVPWAKPVTGLMGTLGLQGARLYDREPIKSVFHAMLDAIANLVNRNEPSLIIPYIVSLEEFRHWRREIEQRLPVSLPVGVMAETPAALLAMQDWFEVADFVSVGCNDLMQCLFAADRDLPELSAHLDPYAPVLFRFLRQAAEAAGDNVGKVQLCGLLAQMPGVLPVLLGMGYSAFSVEPMMIPYLAKTISATTLAQAKTLANEVCAAKDSSEVCELLGLPAAGMVSV